MTGLTLVAIVQASIIMTTNTNSYSDARKDSDTTGRPMIVLVGAEWCPACVEMKNNVIPKMKRGGLLRKVAFAVVDLDRQKKLGRELTGGGPIPQIIMYRKTREGWRRRRLIGGQSVKTLSAFIEEGVRLGKESEKTKPQEKDKPEAKAQPSPKPHRTT